MSKVLETNGYATTTNGSTNGCTVPHGKRLRALGALELAELTAVSPLDGRYRRNTKDIAEYFSEFGLIRYRVHIEVEYFLALMERLPVGRDLPDGIPQKLRAIVDGLTLEQAAEIKATEKVTNHDVKAVEYFIKARFDELGLEKYKEWVHFALTSQDINNGDACPSQRCFGESLLAIH